MKTSLWLNLYEELYLVEGACLVVDSPNGIVVHYAFRFTEINVLIGLGMNIPKCGIAPGVFH